MAPPAADIDAAPAFAPALGLPVKSSASSRLDSPLTYSGSLDQYGHFDVTAVIGREFPKLQLSSILHDDTKIRDLAITGE